MSDKVASDRFAWKSEYRNVVVQLLERHYGGREELIRHFPYLDQITVGTNRLSEADAFQIPAIANMEYHRLERHASQYHVITHYEEAYQHWLMAAFWRIADANASNCRDLRYENAVRYCVKQALYNNALHQWRTSRQGYCPVPEDFELRGINSDQKEP